MSHSGSAPDPTQQYVLKNLEGSYIDALILDESGITTFIVTELKHAKRYTQEAALKEIRDYYVAGGCSLLRAVRISRTPRISVPGVTSGDWWVSFRTAPSPESR